MSARLRPTAARQTIELQEKYDLTVSVTGIITGSHGAAINPDGLNLLDALVLINNDRRLNELSTLDHLKMHWTLSLPARLISCSSHPRQPANRPTRHRPHPKSARSGLHVVTANKGRSCTDIGCSPPWRRIKASASLFESAVMDGAPIFALFRQPLVGANLIGFHGILNSCTNLLLELMEKGQTLEEAVDYGRSIGITENRPRQRY